MRFVFNVHILLYFRLKADRCQHTRQPPNATEPLCAALVSLILFSSDEVDLENTAHSVVMLPVGHPSDERMKVNAN